MARGLGDLIFGANFLMFVRMKIYSHQNLLHHVYEKEFIDSPEFESSVSGDEKYQVIVCACIMCL